MAPPYLHELAISAVAYDACLVTELTRVLAARLDGSPIWSGSESFVPGGIVSRLHESESRVALLLPQRLWGHDKVTAAEAEMLHERVQRAPKSVIIVTLDDEPLPPWMRRLRQRRLAAVGVDGAVEFVLQTIADAGGPIMPGITLSEPEAVPLAPRWPDPPTPYLRQPRAQSGLRRELDSLCDVLEKRDSDAADRILELQVQPNRIVARLDGVGVSFSWVAGRAGTVSDGRLMVIEWSDVAATRGAGAFRTARATRERSYSVEAVNSDEWYWRAEGPNGRASSTANLVGEWIDGATMMATVQRS